MDLRHGETCQVWDEEGQRAAGDTVRERGGVAPVLWADVDAVRVG